MRKTTTTLVMMLLFVSPAFANTIKTNATFDPSVVTKPDSTQCKKDYKKIVKAIKICHRAEMSSSSKAKLKAFNKALPILEKVKDRGNCPNYKLLADQEIQRIQKIEKLEGLVQKSNQALDIGDGGTGPFMWGPYF